MVSSSIVRKYRPPDAAWRRWQEALGLRRVSGQSETTSSASALAQNLKPVRSRWPRARLDPQGSWHE